MIVVFGSINLDLVARVPRLPRAGETLAGRGLAMTPGGKGANQALAARRAGAQVALFGAVGRDPMAEPALALLRRDGVELGGVREVDGPTGVALIHVDDAGENAITVIAGANAAARAADVPDARLGPGTTLLLQLEVPLAEVLALAGRARARGACVVLNAAPAAPLPDPLLAAASVLVVNEAEATALAGAGQGADPRVRPAGQTPEPDALAACRALARRGLTVVVTRGGAGVAYASEGELVEQPAPAVDVVDTVGAGDAFTGVLAAALDRGAGLERAMTEALAAGSLACTRPGAQAALPWRVDIARVADER